MAAVTFSTIPSPSPIKHSLSPSSSSSSSSSSSQYQNSLQLHNHLSYPSQLNKHKTLSTIQSTGIIACLHTSNPNLALESARAAIKGGISVLELTASTPDVFNLIPQLIQEYPSITFGVGTVLSIEDAKHAIDSGASFLMSPVIVKELLVLSNENVLYIPGVMTPNEIWNVYNNIGAEIVKVYPATVLGGVDYIRAIKKPFRRVLMVASQGIGIDLIGEYILRGAEAVVLSDAIFDKEAMGRGDLKRICELAGRAAAAGREAVRLKKRNTSIF